MTRRLFRIAGILLLLAALAPAQGCGVKLVRVSDGSEVGIDAVVTEAKAKSLLFVGEYHDRPEHHRLQLELIRSLHREGLPVAVGLEMFESYRQPVLDAWVKGVMSQEEFERFYRESWQNLPWSLYEPIFLFARDNRIPLVGLNIPRSIVRKVSREGFAALSEEERKLLPPVTCDVDHGYMEMIRRSYPMHKTGDNSFVHFCEAQMLWNRSMAAAVAAYLRGNPDRFMIVLAGGGHVRRRGGIPEEIEREMGNVPNVVVLPVFPPDVTVAKATADDADYLLVDNDDFLLRALAGIP